jgi:hypothetical protein
MNGGDWPVGAALMSDFSNRLIVETGNLVRWMHVTPEAGR